MADLTHAKLAHRLLEDDGGMGPRSYEHRAERTARANAYAALACADALDRIATVLERQHPQSVDPQGVQYVQ